MDALRAVLYVAQQAAMDRGGATSRPWGDDLGLGFEDSISKHGVNHGAGGGSTVASRSPIAVTLHTMSTAVAPANNASQGGPPLPSPATDRVRTAFNISHLHPTLGFARSRWHTTGPYCK